MERNTNFITELRNAFAGLTELIVGRVNALDDDIDTQVGIIQSAYDEIKLDKAELRAIAECSRDFAVEMGYNAEEADGSADEGDHVIDTMYEMVAERYIEDADYKLVNDDLTEVDKIEDGTDYVSADGDSE